MNNAVSITLYRHGEVDFDAHAWSKPIDLRRLVDCYNARPLRRPFAQASTKSHELIVASTLSRSIESANILFGRCDVIDPLFTEAELPDLFAIPIRLPASTWLVIARMLWRMRWTKNCESYAEFCLRAKEAANCLVRRASKGESVALVGHALLNRSIAIELRKQSFDGPKTIGRAHWSASEFVKRF